MRRGWEAEKEQFQPPLEEAFADFRRERAFIAGTVVGRHGDEIGLAIWKIGDSVARDFSYHERRCWEIICAGSRADVDFIAGQIRLSIRCPCECQASCRRAGRRRSRRGS